MKEILVTGGLGYIGSHTVVALLNQGFNVVIVDDLSNANENVLDGIYTITGVKPKWYLVDVKDLNKLEQVFAWYNFSGVIHFAANKAVGESVVQPLKYYKNNILGLLNVLECCEKYQVKNFIFSSSCTVYGQADQMPINENTPLKTPESPYGKTKQMGEMIIEDWVNASKSKAIALRYFNPVGSHASCLLGDIPNGIPNNLLPYITQTAAGIREYLNVFGNDYNTIDGTAIRDYIDVNDLAEAHVKALQYLTKNSQNEPLMEYYNLGSGKGSTVLEIIHAFEKVNNIKIPYQIVDRRAGDIESAFADYALAKSKLGWEPMTNLETSLKTAWNFQKQYNTTLNKEKEKV